MLEFEQFAREYALQEARRVAQAGGNYTSLSELKKKLGL